MQAQREVSWPGWETVRLIGRGSFGAVYEIQRDLYGRKERAALKMIRIPQNPGDIEELYNDGLDEESITARFRGYLEDIVREYGLMSEMKGCSNVVYCDDFRQEPHEDGIGWDIYIKMELLTPLTRSLGPAISEQQVIRLGADICNALILCKKHNVVHRDIKPQNIFISEDGNYKLGDFGVAKTVERTSGGTKIGTYKYMAPEVYRSEPYGSGADIYSLGLVLYWMLNERRMPFLPLPPVNPTDSMETEARSRRFSGEAIPAPKHGSPALQQIVLKACAYDPKARWVSAAELREALLALSAGQTAPVVLPVGAAVAAEAADEATMGVFDAAPVRPAPGQGRETPKPYAAPEDGEATVGMFGQAAAKQPTPVWGAENCDTKAETVGVPVAAPVRPAPQQAPRQAAPASQAAQEAERRRQSAAGETKKKRRTGLIIGLSAALLILLLLIVLLLKSCGGHPAPQEAEWSGWVDELPSGVTEEDYEIETRRLYRYSELETTTSTDPALEGWECYDSVEGGSYGEWSAWQLDEVQAAEGLEVESGDFWRYLNRETTSGTNQTMSGWTCYDETYAWAADGAWSKWSPTWPGEQEGREIQTATQWQYRDVWTTQSWGDYGAWSAWQDSAVTDSGDNMEVKTRTVYGYYYFECPDCGCHMHVYTNCYTWAGGCGRTADFESGWRVYWCETPYSSVSWKDWHGTGKYYTTFNGMRVFKWTDGMNRGEAIKTQYAYRTRELVTETHYGSYSDWSFTEYTPSSTCEVQTREVYSYQDSTKVYTYYFERWVPEDNWSETALTANGQGQKVEQVKRYRYREMLAETMYYFRRWTTPGEYTTTEIEASDTVQVETKLQYNYRKKQQ